MKYKVRITRLPQARTGYQVQGALANDISNFSGNSSKNYMGKPNQTVRKSMGSVPIDEANLEAEGGETLVGDIDGSTFPSFFNIKGPRHSAGGVPMSLPDDTFIFSDTASMKITDPKILKMFSKSEKKGGYTPAELSKSYDINKYRKILQDPDSDKTERKTAELMIKNYVMKLGALALAQESKKGFPQGVPVIAKPYMEANKITEESLGIKPQEDKQMSEQNVEDSSEEMPTEMPENSEQMPQNPQEMMMYGGNKRRLRRAQEGMQQPSREELMMMQQQAQGQESGQDEMQQLMQQINQALQQGIKPEEIIPELLQNKIPPENIMQIFVELGMPEEEVEQLLVSIIQEMQSGQQGQMDPRQQRNISEEEMMAMQQQDPRQMQQAPMAAYGMQMGGYDMPFYDLPKANKGLIIDKKTGKPRPMTAAELKEKAKRDNAKKVGKVEEGYQDIGDGYYAKGTTDSQAGEKKKFNTYKRTGKYVKPTKEAEEKYLDGICQRMKTGDLQNYTAEELAGQFFDKSFISRMKACESMTGGGKEDIDVVQLEKEPTDQPGEKCYCMDPETGKEVEVELTDGECICTEEFEGSGGGQDSYQENYEQGPEFTTQDKLNMATAARTRTGIEFPSAMTYQYPEVELAKEEWLAKVQALQGQGAKNLDTMASTAGSSNAKQAAAASLQGDIAEGSVNAIAQTQARNVGTENQERLANYQGDVAEGTNRQNIMNLNMDKTGQALNNYRGELNAKDALKTQMMNQGLKNRADIYNMQTEQYAFNPDGIQIFKGGKPINPEKTVQDEIAYAQSLKEAGLEDDEREILLKARYSRYGGPVLKNKKPILKTGGMVYGDMVYPFYYYE